MKIQKYIRSLSLEESRHIISSLFDLWYDRGLYTRFNLSNKILKSEFLYLRNQISISNVKISLETVDIDKNEGPTVKSLIDIVAIYPDSTRHHYYAEIDEYRESLINCIVA